MGHKHRTEGLCQDRLCCRCPLARRADHKHVRVRRLGGSDDFHGWYSLLDHHFNVTPRVRVRRNRRQQLIPDLRRRGIWICRDAQAHDVAMCLPCEGKRAMDDADRRWCQITGAQNPAEHARPQLVDTGMTARAARTQDLLMDFIRGRPSRPAASADTGSVRLP
jgi:hypothetical protein